MRGAKELGIVVESALFVAFRLIRFDARGEIYDGGSRDAADEFFASARKGRFLLRLHERKKSGAAERQRGENKGDDQKHNAAPRVSRKGAALDDDPVGAL